MSFSNIFSKAINADPFSTDGYNVGDEKEFPDGHVRVLKLTPSGVSRWMREGEGSGKAKSFGTMQGQTAQSPVSIIEEAPQEITNPKWVEYNQFLTRDNPFVYCSTYNEMIQKWFVVAYELDTRLEIAKYTGSKEQMKDIEEDFENLDNYYLAFLMYKMSYLIDQIKKFDPTFVYETFIQGNDWNDLYGYYEEVKSPVELDYTKIYEE